MTPEQMATLHAAAFTQSRPWSAGEFASLLASPLCFAVGDNSCFALIRVVADEAELLTIATDPGHIRQGLAGQRMTEWHEQVQAQGVVRAFLEVAADNTSARALYAKCGYEQCGTRTGYYRRPNQSAVDAIVLQRRFTLR